MISQLPECNTVPGSDPEGKIVHKNSEPVLEKQIESHTKLASKKYNCSHCQQSFTRQSNLKSHLVIHSQEKKFTCDTCSSKFRRIHDLKRHLMLHTGERPFLCENCGRRFARGDALIRHKKASGTCSVSFVGECQSEKESSENQIKLPSPNTATHFSTQAQSLETSTTLPAISTSYNVSGDQNNTKPGSFGNTNVKLALPPISSPSIKAKTSFTSSRQALPDKEFFFHSKSDEDTLPSSTPNHSVTKTGSDFKDPSDKADVVVNLQAFSQSTKSSAVPSSVSPALSNESNSKLLSNYQQVSHSAEFHRERSAPDPSSAQPVFTNSHLLSESSSWQIIKMLESRVRALEERLNSSEGRVSFLEQQLGNIR